MPSHTHIKAILFDLDNTLIDWSETSTMHGVINRKHISNIHRYLVDMGYSVLDEEDFFNLYYEIVISSWGEAKKVWAGVNFGRVIEKTLEAAHLNLSNIDLHQLLLAYDWQPVPGVKPYADTQEVLSFLKNNGYKIGLVTNSMQPMWMRDIELSAYDLLQYFDSRVTSGDIGFMKPHPKIYHAVLQQLNITPGEAVFVGDRPSNDIIGANDVGMTSVLMAPPHLKYDLDGVVPDFTINALSDLLPILASLK